MSDTLSMVVERWEFFVPKREFFLVSAPMSDYEDFNRPALRRAIRSLKRTGINAYNPFAFTAGDLSDKDSSFFISRYIPLVTHPRCSGVVLLDGWEESHGALTEVLLAGRFGKPLLRLVECDEAAALEFYEREAITL